MTLMQGGPFDGRDIDSDFDVVEICEVVGETVFVHSYRRQYGENGPTGYAWVSATDVSMIELRHEWRTAVTTSLWSR